MDPNWVTAITTAVLDIVGGATIYYNRRILGQSQATLDATLKAVEAAQQEAQASLAQAEASNRSDRELAYRPFLVSSGALDYSVQRQDEDVVASA